MPSCSGSSQGVSEGGQEVMGGHRRATVVYDLTPKGIIDSPGLLNVDYNKVSAYGHFGKAELPWKK